jgi:pimeloyl-ACP methyl ester carboxylesterase
LSIRAAVGTLVLTAAIGGGCASASSSGPSGLSASPAPSSPSPAAASASPRKSSLPHSAEAIDIGGGRKLYVECTGEGSPTVVFESGDTDDGGAWVKVVPGLVRETRVCTYDRAGTGRSDPAAGCRRMDDIRGDFEALLEAAAIEPPYVLVGTSGGGYLVVGYALAHPDDVAGMVIVDTFPAIDLSKYPPELAFEIGCENPANVEHRDYAAVEHAAWDHRTKVGDVPITVITNDYTGYAQNDDEEHSIEGQQGWFELNPDDARQVVVKSGHNVPGNEPVVVIEAIREILDKARVS